MPNEKVLLEKQQYVAELKEKLTNSAAGVLVDYKGITVAMIPNFVKNCVKLALSTVLLKTPCSVWH